MMFTFSLDGGSRNIFSLAVMNIMSGRLAADGTLPSAFEVLQDKNKGSRCFKFTFAFLSVKCFDFQEYRLEVLHVNTVK